MKRKASILHDEAVIRELRDNPRFAVEYLKTALEEDSEPRVLLIALRRVVQARGIAKIAKTAGVERESLYRALEAWQSEALHASGSDQGSRLEAHG